MSFSTPHRLYRDYVQPFRVDGQFATGAYTLLAAGPPRLANVGGSAGVGAALDQGAAADTLFYPMGLIQQFSLGQNRTFTQLFELGSHRSYFIAGRNVGQASLSSIYYHGPNLLRSMYAYYQDLLPPTIVQSGFVNAGSATNPNPHNVIIPPGYGNIFVNLASDLFTQPVGLLSYMKDSNEDTLAANYLESAVVPNYNFATDSNGVMIQENIALQFERVVPVAVQVVALLTGPNII